MKLTFTEDTDIPSQELGECTTNPAPGIKVQLTNESSVYKWDISMEGPEQSPYAVGLPYPSFNVILNKKGCSIQTPSYTAGRISLQATRHQLPDQNLPS